MFDPAGYGSPQVPPIPMVIRWDELDPAGYEHTLARLADWVSWLQGTYRIPATVIPACWYTHPGLVEDLGHLWTGWLLTRHPDAGVGITGLDWDTRRDQAIPRLRDATAITGCTATRHHPDPDTRITRDSALWRAHLDRDAGVRRQRAVTRAVADAVAEHLHAAEHRDDLAAAALDELAVDPAAATPAEITAVADRLGEIAEHAAATVDQIAADAATTTADIAAGTERQHRVAAARARLSDAAHPRGDENRRAAVDAWRDAVDVAAPARVAADRAAARASTPRHRTGAATAHSG